MIPNDRPTQRPPKWAADSGMLVDIRQIRRPMGGG